MALLLNDLYEETKNKYHLTLLAGEAGLSHLMNWVYISEDLNTSSFLRGGELVITTGVSSSSTAGWLYDFIRNMIARETCGVILNTGKYLRQEDVTDELLTLCQEHSFPLFTMPWEVHIYDITRDYYNRIFLDTQTDTSLSRAFQSVIHHDSDYGKSISLLEDGGFPLTAPYCICTLNTASFGDLPGDGYQSRLSFLLKKALKNDGMRSHLLEN